MNLRELIQWLDQALQPVTQSSAHRQAERNWFLRHVGVTPDQALVNPSQSVSSFVYAQLQQLVYKRTQLRLPIQYILGEASFYGTVFEVGPAVLIPRPETELLVEQVIRYARQHSVHALLDLGTGSGCIAVSLKMHLPDKAVHAVDISGDALALAQRNAQRHHAEVTFYQGEWFAPLQEGSRFDVVVSNPPYIALLDRPTLTPEVRHEPAQALFAPAAPVDLYAFLLAQAQQYLTPQGVVFLELGIGLGADVFEIASALGYQATLHQDYAGIDRILKAQLSP